MDNTKKSIYEIVSGWLKAAKRGTMAEYNWIFDGSVYYAFHDDVDAELSSLHENGALDRFNKDRESEEQRFIGLFDKYYTLSPEDAFSAFENDNAYKTESVYLAEAVVKHIRENKSDYDFEKIRKIAVLITTKSVYPDVICFGLYLFSLFKLSPDSKEGNIIRTLGFIKFFTHFARIAAESAFRSSDYQNLLFEWVQEIRESDEDNLPHGDYMGHIETELIANIKFDTKEKINWYLGSEWLMDGFYYW